MLRTSIISIQRSFGVRLFNSPASNASGVDAQTLLKVANNLMQLGKVRTAEDIYKSTIDAYPTCHEAYQRLWNSWVTHRSLKVTQRELNDFIEKYKKFVDVENESSASSTPLNR